MTNPKKTFSGVVAYDIKVKKGPDNHRMLKMDATFELKEGKVLCSVQVAHMPKANMEAEGDALPTEDIMKTLIKARAQAIVEVFYTDKAMPISNIEIIIL